jgi:redox-sensitive bicupin YhaK (pirin superfamily)
MLIHIRNSYSGDCHETNYRYLHRTFTALGRRWFPGSLNVLLPDSRRTAKPLPAADYAGPHHFPAGTGKRGVGEHPHRGFETVTVVYSGEVEHRDSTGRGGVIGPGDVQWMTAGAGILHEEFHSAEFTRTGGELKMIQLWVNLPAKDKMTQPGYQSITADVIPDVELPNNAGHMRVIAGRYEDIVGPAHTFSPLNVWDLQLNQSQEITLHQPAGWSTALVVLEGEVVNGEGSAREVSWWCSARKRSAPPLGQ